ncbi:MAG: MOSC domain-containing protein [Pseudomonadota bacterium]|nr:MOSC domain-containing protein [Pseudomonadota bacterium]
MERICVNQIWRYPIKSLGAEKVETVFLREGRTFPGDRVWALTYENSRFDSKNPVWAPCQVFLRGSIAPLFAAVSASTDYKTGFIKFSHPHLEEISLNLDEESDRERFVSWVRPICPQNAPRPSRLCKVEDRGMTDTDYPSISVNSIESLVDLSEKTGVHLNPRRFRGNLWLTGLTPWQELSLIGKKIKIGTSCLQVVEPIVRCNLTKTNEKTGERDVDTLSALEKNYGHKNFGVYCQVLRSGEVSANDLVDIGDN